jgi:mannose-6-phosphate isomerase-like protein (cupin superfamily)
MILDQGPGYLVKRLVVNPGHQTSLQRHRLRSEEWLVVGGKGMVSGCPEEDPGLLPHVQNIWEGIAVTIDRNSWHRVKCISPEPLVIIETWLGEQLFEDDIERKEDDYGRV